MPDRRRHGAHEDRSAAGAQRKARSVAARPAGRLSAALCALCGEAAWLMNLRDAIARRGEILRSGGRLQRAAQLAEVACGYFRRHQRRLTMTANKRRSRAVRRHFQSLFRARKHRRRARGAERRRLSRACREASRRRTPVCAAAARFSSVGKVDEARQEAERTLAALAPFVRRPAGHRARTKLSVQLPRRNPCAGQNRCGAESCRRARCCSRNFWPARRRPASSSCRSRP